MMRWWRSQWWLPKWFCFPGYVDSDDDDGSESYPSGLVVLGHMMIMMKVKMKVKVMKVKVMKSESESYPSSLVVPGHVVWDQLVHRSDHASDDLWYNFGNWCSWHLWEYQWFCSWNEIAIFLFSTHILTLLLGPCTHSSRCGPEGRWAGEEDSSWSSLWKSTFRNIFASHPFKN